MLRPPDLVVIGGGAAGVAAALAARAAGAAVTVVRAGPGATALARGGWRGEAPAAIRAALGEVGHPLEPVAGAIPDLGGWVAGADLAPPWHSPAGAEGTLVCGISGLPGFNAPFLARAWPGQRVAAAVQRSRAAPPASAPEPAPFAVATLELPGTPAGGWSPVALAAAIARAPERLGEALARLARGRGATSVLLPPCLGLEDAQQVWQRASAAAGLPLREALGGLPSLPGWRVDAALLRALAHAGVTRVDDRVAGAQRAGGRISALRLAGGGELRPGAVVLATGKFLGGGIEARPALREPALGLEVVLQRTGATFTGASPLLTTDLARGGDQALLRAGVRVDREHRPLAAGEHASPSNVRVAGSVREGWDTPLGGLGRAAADGWAAALAVLEAA